MVSSVSDLFPRSKLLSPDTPLSIAQYRVMVQNNLAEALERQMDRDWDRAALLFMRVAQLITRTLSTHPAHDDSANVGDIREMRRIAGRCFEALEDIQAVLTAPESGDSSPVTPTTPTAPTHDLQKPDAKLQRNASNGSALPDLPRKEKGPRSQTNTALRAAAVAAAAPDTSQMTVKQRALSDLDRRNLHPKRSQGLQDTAPPRPMSIADSPKTLASRGRSFNVPLSTPSSGSGGDDQTDVSLEDRSTAASNRMKRTLSSRRESAVQKFEGTSMSLSTKRMGERSKSATSRRDRGYAGTDFVAEPPPPPPPPVVRTVDQASAQALLKKNSASVSERDPHGVKRRTSGFIGMMGKVRARGQKIFGSKQVVMVEPSRPTNAPAQSIITNPFLHDQLPSRLHSFSSNKSRSPSSRDLRPFPARVPATSSPYSSVSVAKTPGIQSPEELRLVEIQNDILRVFEKMSRESSSRGLRTLALLAAKREQVEQNGEIVISAIVFPQQTPVSDDRVEITDPKELASLEHVKGLSLVGIMISNLEQHAKLNVEDIRACAALQSKVPEAFTVLVPPNDPARRGLYSLTSAGLELVRTNPKATDSDMTGTKYYDETRHVRICHEHDMQTHIKIYDLRGGKAGRRER